MRTPSAITGVSCRIERQPDAIAIGPWLTGQQSDLRGRRHAAALQRLTQNGLLELELRFISSMLILAAAARTKVAAAGRHAFRSSGDDLFNFGRRVAALLFHHADSRLFAGQRERHKDGFAFVPRQKGAAIDGFLN